MLFLVQCPTSAYLPALVRSPPWLLLPAWPLLLSMLNSARPWAVRESMEGIKGHQNRIAEFALLLFLHKSLHKKQDNRVEQLWVVL